MIELKAPPGKIRVVRTGLVGGRHDYEELVKDCGEIEEAFELIITNNAQRKSDEVYFGYDERGGCIASLAIKENGQVRRCKEIVIQGNGEPAWCDAELEQITIRKPYAPFTMGQNDGRAESPNWIIRYCLSCHTSTLHS